jgi:hypothetical protein
VRACLSTSTLVVAKEAMRDSFTASPATPKLDSLSCGGGLARKSVAALPWLQFIQGADRSEQRVSQRFHEFFLNGMSYARE